MKQYLLAASLLLAGATAAQAQHAFSLGPEVGGVLSRQNTAPGSNYVPDYRLGWLAGAHAYLSWGKLAVQPALLVAQRGYRHETEFYQEIRRTNVRLTYLTLPINLSYAPLGDKHGPQVFAGPYVSVALTGSDVTTYGGSLPTPPTKTIPILVRDDLDATTDYTGIRHIDAGVQGGLGFRYEHLLAQATYSLGLRSITPTYTSMGQQLYSPPKHNYAFQFSLTYLFGIKS